MKHLQLSHVSFALQVEETRIDDVDRCESTLSEGTACFKQRTHKPSITERCNEETVAEKKPKKNKTKATRYVYTRLP